MSLVRATGSRIACIVFGFLRVETCEQLFGKARALFGKEHFGYGGQFGDAITHVALPVAQQNASVSLQLHVPQRRGGVHSRNYFDHPRSAGHPNLREIEKESQRA